MILVGGALLLGCGDDEPADPGATSGPSGCAGDAMCNDGNGCTDDACVNTQCVFTPKAAGGSCSDDDVCNGDEVCDAAGQCMLGTPIPVEDDGLACTADNCDPVTGAITHDPIPACIAWEALPTTGAPSPRHDHTAVWTGSAMIVWGGAVPGMEKVTATGGVYDPATQMWRPTSTVGAPSARHSHVAAWTGSRMIVWGGAGAENFATGGGLYDPVADTWTAMTTAGEPEPRTMFAAAWTGSALVAWGGFTAPTTVFGNGGIYDPATNAWSAVASAGAPGPRFGHSAVWADDRVIFWGGQDLADWNNSGGMLAPTPPPGGQWISPTSANGAPTRREGHSAVWTGAGMVVWGGWDGGNYAEDGAILDPAGGAWVATSTAMAPSPRRGHAALWTGEVMVVWGGYAGDSDEISFGDGGRFTPSADGGAWNPIPEVTTLSARRDHTAVWTGDSIIVWGGRAASGPPTDTGAIGVP